LSQLRQAARLLELRALMKVEAGKPDEAATAIADSFSAARALRNEPMLISQLVRIAVVSISVNTLERVLAKTTLGDQQLTDLTKAIVCQEKQECLRRAMAGERCMGEDLFLNDFSRYGGPGTRHVGTAGLIWKWSGLKGKDHLTHLKLMGKLVRAASGSEKEMRDLRKDSQNEVEQVAKYYFVTKLVVPALPRSLEEQLKAFARLRAARAGIAVERFRMANGRLPDSLDELTPRFLDTVPADPFDDRPIRYKKLAKGFVTYSIGPDQKDHGGKERDLKKPSAPYDITFIVAR
jgi:hypothetical protein